MVKILNPLKILIWSNLLFSKVIFNEFYPKFHKKTSKKNFFKNYIIHDEDPAPKHRKQKENVNLLIFGARDSAGHALDLIEAAANVSIPVEDRVLLAKHVGNGVSPLVKGIII